MMLPKLGVEHVGEAMNSFPRCLTARTLEFQVLEGIHFSIFQGIIGKKNSELSTNSFKEIKVVTFLGNHKTS